MDRDQAEIKLNGWEQERRGTNLDVDRDETGVGIRMNVDVNLNGGGHGVRDESGDASGDGSGDGDEHTHLGRALEPQKPPTLPLNHRGAHGPNPRQYRDTYPQQQARVPDQGGAKEQKLSQGGREG